jgi:purine/pyrimidine-nucleoside phosphorylase
MKHSVYFEGKVQSLSLNTEKGNATVGVIEPGKYSFGTAAQETMVIVSGELKYKLPGKDWKTCKSGNKFVVEPKVTFEVEAGKDAAYICFYK